MPLVSTTEVNEDTRGMYSILSILGFFSFLLIVLLVLGYDPLLSPQFLQSEIPAVSHSRPLHGLHERKRKKHKTDEG